MSKQDSLILYYHFFSQPARALKIILESNNVKYTPQKVNLFRLPRFQGGIGLEEEFKNITRFQKVPVIKHNDFVLTESVAIIRYLCRETNIADDLYPKDSKKQAKVDEFLEWHHIELRQPCMAYFIYKFIRTVAYGKQPDPEQEKILFNQMEEACDRMENLWLSDTPYICGSNITIADIFGACELEQPKMAGYDPRNGRPKLSAWFKRVEQDLHPYYADSHEYLNEVSRKYKDKLPESFDKIL